jgi:acyl carrier protein
MAPSETEIHDLVQTFLVRIEKERDFDRSTNLHADGLELDSLETAELSALLEDEYGTDPFSAEAAVVTFGDLLQFYASAPAGS